MMQYRLVPDYDMKNTCLIIGCDQDHSIVCLHGDLIVADHFTVHMVT